MTLSPTAQKEWDDLQDQDCPQKLTLQQRKNLSAQRTRDRKRGEKGLPPRIAGDPSIFSNDYAIAYYESLATLNQAQSEQYQKAKLAKEQTKERLKIKHARHRERKKEKASRQLAVFKAQTPKKYHEVDHGDEYYKIMSKYMEHYNKYPGIEWLMATLNMFAWTDEGCDPKLLIKLKANRAKYGIKN
jgi:hypothetical protein